ncbi:MAG TPA: hypothetical protein VNV62_18995 [Trebonia sp.]|nr:hypothetical protein [Trebonia sp.]
MDSISVSISRAAVMEERYRSRLPRSLDDLTGPDHGTIQLPLHVAWSGMTAFDVDLPKRCMSMYHIVLTEGQRDDVAAYINRQLLLSYWPVLRKMIGRIIREVWESAFPELNGGQPEAA